MAHYAPSYGPGFTNHLPMYEAAMRSIGVSEAVIHDRRRQYIDELGLKDLETAKELTEFEAKYLYLYDDFLKKIGDQGSEKVLKEFLGDKKWTMASGLFHGMIRLSYAMKHGDDEELARALAYYAMIAKEWVLSGKLISDEDMREAWDDLMDRRLNVELPQDRGGAIETLLTRTPTKEAITEITVSDKSARRMVIVFANWYLKTRDFFVLHIMTGFEALMSLEPWIDDFDEWLGAYWLQAQVYAMLTKERLPVIPVEIKPWEASMEEALAITDPHDVKLYYSLYQLYQQFPQKVLMKLGHIVAHKYWHQHP